MGGDAAEPVLMRCGLAAGESGGGTAPWHSERPFSRFAGTVWFSPNCLDVDQGLRNTAVPPTVDSDSGTCPSVGIGCANHLAENLYR